MPAKRLTPKLARDLAAADAKLRQARAALAGHEQALRKLRERARPFLPAGEVVTVADVSVKRSLSVVPEHVVKEHTRETWTVNGG